MKSYMLALAALAAIGFAGGAYAGELTAPKAMTDAEMDKVTAGRELTVIPPSPSGVCGGSPCGTVQQIGRGPSGNAFSRGNLATNPAAFFSFPRP